MRLCQGVFGRLRLRRAEGGAGHLLPNALPPVFVVVTMGIGAIAGAEVVLSWVRIGMQN